MANKQLPTIQVDINYLKIELDLYNAVELKMKYNIFVRMLPAFRKT